MRLRDATRSKVNWVLLKYATETNCRWLSKIGVNPANYIKGTQIAGTDTYLNISGTQSSAEAQINTGADPAINLSTDQLVRMVDSRFVSNVIQELFR